MLSLTLVLLLAAPPQVSAFVSRVDALRALRVQRRLPEAISAGASLIKELEGTVSANPKDTAIRLQLGRAKFYADDLDGAAQTLDEVLLMVPNDANANLYRGGVAQQLGELPAAHEYFVKVTELAPRDPRGWTYLGGVLLELKHEASALAALHKALTLEAQNVDALCLLGQALIDEGRGEEGIALLEKALSLRRSDLQLNDVVGRYYQEAGHYERARRHFETTAKEEPWNPFARARLVQVNQALGDVKGRERWRKEVLALYSGELSEQSYVRDRFAPAGMVVEASERFKLVHVWSARYEFRVVDAPDEKWDGRVIALRSRKPAGDGGITTQWVLEEQIPRGRRYAAFDIEPSYEEVKQLVIDVLEGRRK